MRRYLYPTLLVLVAVALAVYFYSSPASEEQLRKEKLIAKGLLSENEGEEKEKEKDRPDLAAQLEFEMTKSPITGEIPMDQKLEAFEITRKALKNKSTAKAIDNVVWTERGPNNVGGRTRAMMFDPNDANGKKVWAGTVAGGIWYNNDITDGDQVWQNVDDFMSNIAISTMTYDPANTTTFYAGTGLIFTGRLRGGGIFKSTDGGSSWQLLESTNPSNNVAFRYTQKVIVTPTGKVIAGTGGGIMVSTNGGTSWKETLDEVITDVELATDGTTLYASNYDADIFKSTDAGESWTRVLVLPWELTI